MRRAITIKDVALSASLANLCLISEWNRLLYPAARFSMDYSPAAIEYAGILCNLGLLAGLFLVLAFIFRRIEEKPGVTRVVSLGFAGIVLLLPVNWLRLQAALRFQHISLKGLFNHTGEIVGIICITVTLLAMAIVLLRWYSQILKIFVVFVLMASPFCLVTTGQSIAKVLKNEPAIRFADRTPVPVINASTMHKARVLIIIFDEMDQRLAFSNRMPGLTLPEFDRLRKEALSADNAFPPAMNTIQSMPAFITGKLVKNVWPQNQQELLLDIENTDSMVPWSSQPNIFSSAHDMGLNTALVGRAIPYSRIIGSSLTQYLLPGAYMHAHTPDTLVSAMRYQLLSIAKSLPLATRFDLLGKLTSRAEKETILKHAIAVHESNLENSKKIVIDARYSLILVHYDVPHQPWIFNRVEGNYSWSGDGTYQDNLALADRTLGSLRQEMEHAGVWDSTTLLITSDHWLRSDGMDRRIPFLLKLAGQKEEVHFNKPFNTVMVYDLVHALLVQEISSYSSLVSWIDSHRTIGPSPYY